MSGFRPLVTRFGLREHIREYFPDADMMETFMGYLEQVKVGIDECLIRQGDPPVGIYFLARGRVRVELALDNDERVRLRTMGEGTIVGELGIYLDRPATANVVTEMPSTLYFLSSEALERMEEADAKVAVAFHRYLATILGQRLVDTNTTVQALLD